MTLPPLPEDRRYSHDAHFSAEQMRDYGAACAKAEREAIAQMLDAEHAWRKHLDNHAAVYARMVRRRT